MGLQQYLQLRSRPKAGLYLANSDVHVAAAQSNRVVNMEGVSRNACRQHYEPLPSSVQVDPVHRLQPLLSARGQDSALLPWELHEESPQPDRQSPLPFLNSLLQHQLRLYPLHPDSSIRHPPQLALCWSVSVTASEGRGRVLPPAEQLHTLF